MDDSKQDVGKADPSNPDKEFIDAGRTWSMRLEEADKEAKDYFDEVERSIKWLRLNRNGRPKKTLRDKLNIAFANYEILCASTYSRAPKIVVQPRFGGGPMREQLDAAAQVMERSVESNNERVNLHATLLQVRDDLMKAGRGTLWARYEPTFTEQDMPVLDEATGQPLLDETGQPIIAPQKVKTDERVVFDFVNWKDYREGKAEMWSKVPWVARGVPMNKDDFSKRFGKVRAAECNIKFTEETSGFEKKQNIEGPSVCVWEIWDRVTNAVYFVVKGANQAIDIQPPFLELDGFFPCPEPAMSCHEDRSRRPIPDLLMIEDQLQEIDDLTKRIGALRDALKVRGFYPKGATATSATAQIERAIRMSDDREVLVPVEGWAANGQAKLDIVWLPIEAVVATINQCDQMRRTAIDLVYQITGISDVMRGASDASETLGAQQIKAQWGSVRVRTKQGEMIRVARDACNIAAEIVCELFSPETIEKTSVYGYTPEMLALFRDQGMRPLLLDVETDSTIQADEQQDKKDRMEFLGAIGGMIQQVMPVLQLAPELLPMVGSMLKFAVAGFRVGRGMEKEIDQAMEALQAKMSQPAQPPQPSPDEMAKTEATKVKAEAEVQKSNNEVAMSQIDLQTAIHKSRSQIIASAQPQQPPQGGF